MNILTSKTPINFNTIWSNGDGDTNIDDNRFIKFNKSLLDCLDCNDNDFNVGGNDTGNIASIGGSSNLVNNPHIGSDNFNGGRGFFGGSNLGGNLTLKGIGTNNRCNITASSGISISGNLAGKECSGADLGGKTKNCGNPNFDGRDESNNQSNGIKALDNSLAEKANFGGDFLDFTKNVGSLTEVKNKSYNAVDNGNLDNHSLGNLTIGIMNTFQKFSLSNDNATNFATSGNSLTSTKANDVKIGLGESFNHNSANAVNFGKSLRLNDDTLNKDAVFKQNSGYLNENSNFGSPLNFSGTGNKTSDQYNLNTQFSPSRVYSNQSGTNLRGYSDFGFNLPMEKHHNSMGTHQYFSNQSMSGDVNFGVGLSMSTANKIQEYGIQNSFAGAFDNQVSQESGKSKSTAGNLVHSASTSTFPNLSNFQSNNSNNPSNHSNLTDISNFDSTTSRNGLNKDTSCQTSYNPNFFKPTYLSSSGNQFQNKPFDPTNRYSSTTNFETTYLSPKSKDLSYFSPKETNDEMGKNDSSSSIKKDFKETYNESIKNRLSNTSRKNSTLNQVQTPQSIPNFQSQDNFNQFNIPRQLSFGFDSKKEPNYTYSGDNSQYRKDSVSDLSRATSYGGCYDFSSRRQSQDNRRMSGISYGDRSSFSHPDQEIFNFDSTRHNHDNHQPSFQQPDLKEFYNPIVPRAQYPDNYNFGNEQMNTPVYKFTTYTGNHFFVPQESKFFIIKSYSLLDINASLTHSIWASTELGNKRLNQAYNDLSGNGKIYLFFSVNTSGKFSGVCEMSSPVDFNKTSDAWVEKSRWKGVFSVDWLIIKDVPNKYFHHLKIPSNEFKPVTNSRDTQEVPYDIAISMLKIISSFKVMDS